MKNFTDWLLYDWDGGYVLGVISGIIAAFVGLLVLLN